MKNLIIRTKVSPGSFVLIAAMLLMFLFTLPLGGVRAQEGAEAPATATDSADKENLVDVLKKGGVWMFPLAGLSIAAVGLIVNNFMMLQRKKLTRDELLPSLLEQLANRDIDGALQSCSANPCLFTNILEGGLGRITTDEIVPANIRLGIEETGQAQMANLIKPVNYLTNIASVAPMVGLLGTVSGMIKAFEGLGAGQGADPAEMANNISEALVTTASGLFIAIPAMLFYFYFKNNFAESMTTINAEVGRLLNALETGAVMYVPSDDMGEEDAHGEEA